MSGCSFPHGLFQGTLERMRLHFLYDQPLWALDRGTKRPVPHQTMGFAKCRSMWPRVVCQDMLCMCFLLQQLAVIAKWQDLQQDRIVHIFLPASIESFPMCCTRGCFTGLFNQPLDNGPTMNKTAVLLDLDLRLFGLCLEWRQLALFMALVTLYSRRR